MSRRLITLATLALALAAGCSNDTPTSSSSTDTTTTTTTTSTTPITTPVTVTFSGQVGPGGTASRTFSPQIPGTVTVSLGGISPATALGIGLGIPRSDGSGCLLGISAVAASGAAEVSSRVDLGTYCAQVFAPAQTAAQVSFTVTLVHP